MLIRAVSAPHNFLKVNEAMEEPTKTREWIIARIVKTEEAIASGGEVSHCYLFLTSLISF